MIAHVDADSFFASVLARKNPSFRGKELLALGMGGKCVIAASYEAKAKGIKTGMTLRDALNLAPDAIRAPSDFQETGLASQQIESVLQGISPHIEQMSIDEWFLDLSAVVGGTPKDLSDFAKTLRQNVLLATSLSVSVGIAASKTLAKMASEYRKPGGVTVIKTCHLRPPHHDTFTDSLDLQTFLLDRPAAAIPGIGPRRQTKCEGEGWKTAWDIAQADAQKLKHLFGRPGIELAAELRGESMYALVVDSTPPKSISRARSFPPSRDHAFLWAHVLRHLEYAILKMRRERLSCRGVSVWIRDGQYAYRSAHCSLPHALETEETIQPFVRQCLLELLRKDEMCTQAGIALWGLHPHGALQFSLFEEPKKAIREENVQSTIDALHEKFGRNSVTRGSAMQVQTGTKKPGLPYYKQ